MISSTRRASAAPVQVERSPGVFGGPVVVAEPVPGAGLNVPEGTLVRSGG
jgi:hypothetical protein